MQQEEQEWEAAPICLLEVGALRQGRDPLQAAAICPAYILDPPVAAFSPLAPQLSRYGRANIKAGAY